MSRKQRRHRRKSNTEAIAERFLNRRVLFKTPDGDTLDGVVREVKDFTLRIDSVKGRTMSSQFDVSYKDVTLL